MNMLESGLKYISEGGLDRIYAGTELVLRSYLYSKSFTYIFADMNQADKDSLAFGSYEPVCYTDCIDRLENLCGVKMPSKDKKALLDLQKKKNCAEFSDDVNEKATQAVIYRAVGAVIAFVAYCKAEMKFSKIEKDLIKEIQEWYSDLSGQHRDALNEADALVEGLCNEDKRKECPSCGEAYLIPDSGKCHCYFCGYEAEGEKAAKAYLFNVKGLNERKIRKSGEVYPLYKCPTCKKMALVENECFACRRVFDNRKTVIPNQAEGIAAAKAKGVKFGRPKIELPKNFDEVYQLWKDKKITAKEAAERLKMPPSTFWYRVKNYKG